MLTSSTARHRTVSTNFAIIGGQNSRLSEAVSYPASGKGNVVGQASTPEKSSRRDANKIFNPFAFVVHTNVLATLNTNHQIQ